MPACSWPSRTFPTIWPPPLHSSTGSKPILIRRRPASVSIPATRTSSMVSTAPSTCSRGRSSRRTCTTIADRPTITSCRSAARSTGAPPCSRSSRPATRARWSSSCRHTATRPGRSPRPSRREGAFRRYSMSWPRRFRSKKPDAAAERAMTRIEEIARHDGRRVTLRGWLANRRSSGKIHFLQIRDGSGFIQGVMSRATVGDGTLDVTRHLGQETAIEVEGDVRADTRAPGGYEIDITALRVVGPSTDYPITPKEHGPDFLLDRRHLWIRSSRQQAVLRIRHEVIDATRDYLNSRGFVLADTPIFTPAACEGTTTLFPVPYFDHGTVYLT